MKPNPKKSIPVPRDILLFVLAVVIIGFSRSIYEAIFNNFLERSFTLTGMGRTFLELPRELPGLFVIVFSGILFFMGNRTVAAFAQLLSGVGFLMVGMSGHSYATI